MYGKMELVKALKALPDHELIDIYNKYLLKENLGKYYIYNMDSFDSVFEGCYPLTIASIVYDSPFNPNDNYFYKIDDNKLQSFNSPNETLSRISYEEIALYCIKNDCDFDSQEIRDILKSIDVFIRLVPVLQDLASYRLVEAYNKFQEKENLGEEIYDMDDLETILGNVPIRNVLFDAYEGDFNPNNNYFYYDENGNLHSFNDLTDEFNIDSLADYCITEGDDLGIEEIRKVLDTTKE